MEIMPVSEQTNCGDVGDVDDVGACGTFYRQGVPLVYFVH